MIKNIIFTSVRAIRALRRRLLNRISTSYYRLVCNQVGKRSRISWGVWIANPSCVSIGTDVYIGSAVSIGTENLTSKCNIGNGVQINDAVQIDFTGGLLIEDGVLISENSIIYTHSHGHDPRSLPQGFPKTIRRNVWIGTRCIIMHSCQLIEENAVIGAGVISTKAVMAGAVVVSGKSRIIN